MNATLIRKTPIGPVALVWQASPRGAVVHRVFLSNPERPADEELRRLDPDAAMASCPDIRAVVAGIRALLRGADVEFDLDLVALEACPPFQQAVLRSTWKIPRGGIDTYGRLAEQLGKPGAARAVGNALADNPFPLLIPCHRVVRAGGQLGGFGGGPVLKRALLALEGVEVDSADRVVAPVRHAHPRSFAAGRPPIARGSATSRRSP